LNDPVVNQLDAYNAQDLDAFCACYHDDVKVEDGNGKLLSAGIEAFRSVYAVLFARHPANRAEVVHRTRIGAWVVDEEIVSGRGAAPLRAVAIYRLREGRIAQVRFLGETD
jgi:hypothetical protein